MDEFVGPRKSVDAVLRKGSTILLVDQPITYRRERQPVWWKRLLKIKGPMVAVDNNGVWICRSHGTWSRP